MKMKVFRFRSQRPDWLSSCVAERGKTAACSACENCMEARVGKYRLLRPVSCPAVVGASRGGPYRTSVEGAVRAISRVIAPFSRKNGDARTPAQGCERGVASLCGY